jgi:hypothetical protein
MKLIIGTLCMFFVSICSAEELVKTCRLGTQPDRNIAIVRDSKIADTHIYYLRRGADRTPFFNDAYQSRGSSVRVECVGKRTRALLVSGEFTANSLQGFVINFTAGSSSPERLDFAEKNRPQRIYLNSHEIIVVVPTHGLGETNARYVAYHHTVGRADADSANAIDKLPSQKDFEVIELNRSKPK